MSSFPIEKIPVSDEGLQTLAAAAAGDGQSFTKVCSQYLPMIKKIWRSCPVEGLEFDDWYQESQLVILRTLKTYRSDGGAQFSWFLKESLVNRAVDLYRQRKAQKRIPSTEMESIDDLAEAVVMTNSEPLMDDLIDIKNGLADFWEQSSRFERQVMSGIQAGQSVAELARRYGCRQSKIQSAKSRCRKKLINILRGR